MSDESYAREVGRLTEVVERIEAGIQREAVRMADAVERIEAAAVQVVERIVRLDKRVGSLEQAQPGPGEWSVLGWIITPRGAAILSALVTLTLTALVFAAAEWARPATQIGPLSQRMDRVELKVDAIQTELEVLYRLQADLADLAARYDLGGARVDAHDVRAVVECVADPGRDCQDRMRALARKLDDRIHKDLELGRVP